MRYARSDREINFTIREERGGKCEVCGWPKGIDGLKVTHAHHITHRARGGKPHQENVIVLCPNHHALAHSAGMPKTDNAADFIEAVTAVENGTGGEFKASIRAIPQPRVWLTTRMAAAHLGVSHSTLVRWMADTSIPFIRHHRIVRFEAGALDRWMLKRSA